jgi:hypothetical protein
MLRLATDSGKEHWCKNARCISRFIVRTPGFWSQVTEWPGCFATGETLQELMEAIQDNLALRATPDGHDLTESSCASTASICASGASSR